MKTSYKSELNLFNKIYDSLPAFVDVFDEETFYIFAVIVTLSTCVIAFILSRFVTIKPVEL